MTYPKPCPHGQFPTDCELCEQAAEIARLTAELEKCREDAERWNHCIAVGRFPSICQDGRTWMAWKTESPTSNVSGKSPGQAIDAALRSL